MSFEAYTSDFPLYKQRFEIAAKLAGVTIPIKSKDQHLDAMKRAVAFGDDAVLDTRSGEWLTSNAAVLHIVHPTGAPAAATQWAQFGAVAIDEALKLLLVPTAPKGGVKEAEAHLSQALEWLNHQLETRTWLVGERVGAADVAVAFPLLQLFKGVWGQPRLTQLPHLRRWLLTCAHHPAFSAVLGSYEIAATDAKGHGGDAKAKGGDDKKDKAKSPKKGGEKKEKEAKPAPKPKEAKAEKAPEPKDEEEEVAEEPGFTLDKFKRLFQNEADKRGKVIPSMIADMDPTKFSVWFADHKFPDHIKNKLDFQLINLIGGFFQRMDSPAVHRMCFGLLALSGKKGSWNIGGAFVFEGLDLPEPFKGVDDHESYQFTKVPFPPTGDALKKLGDVFSAAIPEYVDHKVFV